MIIHMIMGSSITLEPCEMCLGAIVMSDVVNYVVFALADRWINPLPMLEMPHVKRHIHNYVGGVLAEESMALWQHAVPMNLLYFVMGIDHNDWLGVFLQVVECAKIIIK